ncbi:cupin domain-containing protein [Haoranjiania flava]|uniref:Cupin domain-containing protein n=1 Tax=Haoranjiania flava TaxID=1856322 RepID=A0AAE3IPI0_9BACT|nr:cupin domain-containing protein [Haoranjiania flava]MCU7694940.1 cupin domain-containing protein [Haoranjiania flava]
MAKTFDKGVVLNFDALVDYSADGVVSKQVLKNDAGNITLFSFDKEQGLTEHTSPYDALVSVIDGVAEIAIKDEKHLVKAGESIILPANIPHALLAIEKFKMLLTMIKG